MIENFWVCGRLFLYWPRPLVVSLRVFCVSDSAVEVELIRLELARPGFDVKIGIAETRAQFLAAIKGRPRGTWSSAITR